MPGPESPAQDSLVRPGRDDLDPDDDLMTWWRRRAVRDGIRYGRCLVWNCQTRMDTNGRLRMVRTSCRIQIQIQIQINNTIQPNQICQIQISSNKIQSRQMKLILQIQNQSVSKFAKFANSIRIWTAGTTAGQPSLDGLTVLTVWTWTSSVWTWPDHDSSKQQLDGLVGLVRSSQTTNTGIRESNQSRHNQSKSNHKYSNKSKIIKYQIQIYVQNRIETGITATAQIIRQNTANQIGQIQQISTAGKLRRWRRRYDDGRR